MIRNLKVLGLAIGAVLAMSAIASSPASAAPEFTCAKGGVHVSCTFKGTTEPGTKDIFKGSAPLYCHNTYEASDADGTATKLLVVNTGVKKPFDAKTGATTEPDCETEVAGVRFTTDIDFQGCGYEFHATSKVAENEYTAEADIVCPTPENMIDLRTTNSTGGTKCTITLQPTTGVKHIILKNTVNPTTGKEAITINWTTTSIKYTVVEGGILGCGKANATYGNGEYVGQVTVEAFDTGGNPIDVTVASE